MLSVRYTIPLFCLLLSWVTSSCARDFPSTVPAPPVVISKPGSSTSPATPSQPGSSTSPTPPTPMPLPPPSRLYLANDKVRLGIDLNAGGCLTYLSEAGSTQNMINNSDFGRQIQTSLYAAPSYFTSNGKQPVYYWRNLGWNPVQVGDYYNHSSRIISYQQGPNTLYVKSTPLIWPLFDEPAECTFEHWTELKDNAIHVRCRITVYRSDKNQYEARTQELPAVYLNAPYYRIISYVGQQPFTNDRVSEFYDDGGYYFRHTPEHWTALVNEFGRGVGLYKPDEVRFGTNNFGPTPNHTGGEFDQNAVYMNTQPFLLIDHNGQYEYEYTLIVGSINEIRQFAYQQPRSLTYPEYRFTKSRLGWYYFNTGDKGWPIDGELNTRWEPDSLQKTRFYIRSPMASWNAADAPKLYIQAAFQTKATVARLVWLRPQEHREIEEVPGRYVDFPIVGDGEFRTYELNMSQLPGWQGLISQLSLTSPESQAVYEKGSTVRIRSVTSTPP